MARTVAVTLLCAVAVMFAAAAQSGEYVTYESAKYGYSLKLPKELKMTGEEGKTTNWSYQPGSVPEPTVAAAEKPKGKKGLGGLVKGVAGAVAEKATGSLPGAPAAAAPSQELEPALTISVNWVYMPDVGSGSLFATNKKADLQDINSPDPTYKELVVLDKKDGYAMEGGSAYRYKEVDKKDPNELHRWHVKAFGNKSMYTLGFTGTYKQFEKWGPEYEECIKSFKLVPMKPAQQ